MIKPPTISKLLPRLWNTTWLTSFVAAWSVFLCASPAAAQIFGNGEGSPGLLKGLSNAAENRTQVNEELDQAYRQQGSSVTGPQRSQSADGWKAASPDGNQKAGIGGARPLQPVDVLPKSFHVPVAETPLPEQTRVEYDGNALTIVAREAPLNAVLNAISDKMNLNVVSSGGITGTVSLTLHKVPVRDALDSILSINGYRWVLNNNIMMVSSLTSETQLPPIVQGRQVRVFSLDFVSATEISTTIQQLLSPVGTSSISEVVADNKLRTREQIVVEDLPEYLARIEKFILQTDTPPQQVLIEAHILQVKLGKDNRHGVKLENIAGLASGDVSFGSNGIASTAATPSFFLNIDSSRVQSVIDMIETTTDAKTLASPRVLAVNGQEAKIQIGEQLGFLTATTTQTSTVQSVNFLDLGVLLRVTPVISRDGRILMSVAPEVSSGRINQQTGLPDAETTEVTTTCLLPNGHSMIVGGLIQEKDEDTQSRMPVLGSAPIVGKLFQRRNREKDRSEIIIVLTPRIVPYGDAGQHRHIQEVQQATSPLMYGPLISVDRRQYEPQLPGAAACLDPLGKSIDCFPTPPVAYSQHSPGFTNPAGRYSQRIDVPNARYKPGLSQHGQHRPGEPVLPQQTRPPAPAEDAKPLPPVQEVRQTSGSTSSRLKNAAMNLFRRTAR